MNQNKNDESTPAFVKRDNIVSGKEYALLLGTLKERFRKSRIKAAVKVNTAMLEFYWEMGRDVLRLYENAKYGSAFFDCLSLDLKAEFPGQTGFSVSNIKYAKRWFEFYNKIDANRQRLVDDFKNKENGNRHQLGDDLEMPIEFGEVPWGQHIDIFTKSKSVEEALFYVEQTIKNNWSRPELNAEMDDDLYNKQGKAITNFDDKLPAPFSGLAKEILKSPYDFGFIDKKITSSFFPDYAGKLNFYVSAVDELMKQPDDNPTIGLLICKSKDNTVVEWSFRGMSQPMGVAEFKTTISKKVVEMLPSESELQRMIDTYDTE